MLYTLIKITVYNKSKMQILSEYERWLIESEHTATAVEFVKSHQAWINLSERHTEYM